MTRHHPAADRGSLSLELVVLAPAILLILALVIAGGRIALASQAVAQAAAQAARDASLQPSVAAATTAARARAATVLEGQGLGCAPSTVTVNATAVTAALGCGAVTTRVECTVKWTDLGIPGRASARCAAPGRRLLALGPPGDRAAAGPAAWGGTGVGVAAGPGPRARAAGQGRPVVDGGGKARAAAEADNVARAAARAGVQAVSPAAVLAGDTPGPTRPGPPLRRGHT